MTTPLKPMDREAWEARIRLVVGLYTKFADPDTEFFGKDTPWQAYQKEVGSLATEILALQTSNETLTSEVCTLNNRIEEIDRTYNFQREEDATKLVALQSQLTEALAEVERLMEVVKFYADDDTYHIDILGACGLSNDMDEWGQFGKKAKEAIEAIEKARQPK